MCLSVFVWTLIMLLVSASRRSALMLHLMNVEEDFTMIKNCRTGWRKKMECILNNFLIFIWMNKDNRKIGRTSITTIGISLIPIVLSCKHKSMVQCVLTFWRRIFFQILAHPVFKMWVIQEPNKVALWNKRHFEETKMEIIQHV